MEQQPADSLSLAGGDRLRAIDLLRGAVMVLMALDHVRDFFGGSGFNPRDVQAPALFLTRWVTHFCAPVFVLLAGTSAALYGRGRSVASLRRFLVTRGLWLVVLELTVIRWCWTFQLAGEPLLAGVIWAIGWSMVVVAALVGLPRHAIGAIGLAMVLTHNLLDWVTPASLGAFAPWWCVLHAPGPVTLPGTVRLLVIYPLIPWIGVMAIGYWLGDMVRRAPEQRDRELLAIGAATIATFVLLRGAGAYGDPARWSTGGGTLAAALSFVDCEKYPPSLLFLAMTLGPAIMLLVPLARANGAIANGLLVFGRVPLFYYVLHLALIHALALALARIVSGDAGWLVTAIPPLAKLPEYGYGLPLVYAVWVAVVILLLLPCRWFAGVKQRRRDWWLSYL